MPPAESVWLERLNAVREYIDQHDGKYPPFRRKDPELGKWWHAEHQRPNMIHLSAARAKAVRDTMALAKERKQQATERNRDRNQEPDRAAVQRAARKAITKARKMLDSPYLVPGDLAVLQLRIDHPSATLAELAALAGMTGPAYGSKLRGALNRSPASTPARRR